MQPQSEGAVCVFDSGEWLHDDLLQQLAGQLGVSEVDFLTTYHFDVTQDTMADTVARLGYFPALQSLKVGLECHSRTVFQHYDSTGTYSYAHGDRRARGGLLQYDHSILEAALTLTHLTRLNLTVPSGDCFGQLPWEHMARLKELHTHFTGRIAQGTFSFLPRLCSLEHLQADVDFFSLPSLVCMTGLTSLDICLAPPEGGVVDVAQAQERDNEVLRVLRSLTGLKKLDFCQQATRAGLVHLTELTSLTHLSLRLPNSSTVGLRLWSVVNFFKEQSFNLHHLHFEFKLDKCFAVASLNKGLQHNVSSSEAVLYFPVVWSSSQIVVKKLFAHE